ncbi:hypothetical protein [Thermorudis peleae]|uniref:hypothetical protein n=1 Tax=Thermorudis peleae TaxID=1382356 RepID=UPI00056F60AD|nr:hypothetical protein [Thermorudis peleae]
MSADARIAMVLQQIGEDVACIHYWEPQQVSLLLLMRLGLLSPIRQRIPSCSAHHCPRCGQCAYQADFERDETGNFQRDGVSRGYRKFKLSDNGKRFLAQRLKLERLVRDHPLFPLIASVFRQSGGQQASTLALAEAVLNAALAWSSSANGRTEPPPYTRFELGAYLQVLEDLGWLTRSDDGFTLSWHAPLALLQERFGAPAVTPSTA